jgi:hypothetical protein
MNLLRSNLLILLIGILAAAAGTLTGNSKAAMLISLFIALISFTKKETGILFLLILIPIRPFLITMNPGFKILGDAIIGLLLIRTFFDYRKDIKKLFTFHPFEWGFFAFAIIGVISALLTGVSLQAIVFQLRAYYLFYLLFYIVKRMNFSADFILKMSFTSFFVGVILALQGIVEKISNKTMLMPQEWTEWWLSPTNQIRVYGLLKGPNELSLYLLITFFITLYLLKHIHGKMRYFIYAGLSLIGATILLTYSRGTILTLLVFLLVYFALYLNWSSVFSRKWNIAFSRKWMPFVSIGVVAVISYGLFLGVNQAADQYYNQYLSVESGHQKKEKDKESEGSKRFKEAFTEETLGQSSSNGRIFRVKKSIEILKDHPIIGTGFATFGGAATITYSSPIYKDYGIKKNLYSDNQYVLILTETGILGMLAIAMIGYFLLITTWKNRKEFYGPLLVYFFVALIVGGTVYNILENNSFMMMYFILLGFVFQKRAADEK